MKKGFLIIIVGIIIGGVAAYGVVHYVAVQRAEAEIARLVGDTSALEEIRYGKIEVGLVRSTFGMEDVQLWLTGFNEPILIDRIDLDLSEPSQKIPPQAKAEIKGIRLSAKHELLNPVRTDLEGMGYGDIAGLITFAYRYDAADKRLDLQDVTIQADKMGRIRFDLALTNLDLSALMEVSKQPDIGTLLMTLPMIGVASGRFTYSDDSFLQRLFHEGTEQSGGKPSAYHAESKEKLNQWLKGEDGDRVRQVFSTLKNFIDHPDTVTISLNPAKPVPLIRFTQFLWLNKPMDLLDLFKVQVTI